MKRRQAIKQAALGLGLTMTYGSLLTLASSCQADTHAAQTWTPKVLTESQATFLSDLGDIILPRTDTPSASDVGVAQFIDNFVHDIYKEEDKQTFQKDMAALESEHELEDSRPFSDWNDEEQTNYIKRHEELPFYRGVSMWGNTIKASEMPFYRTLKNLILFAYFTSEEVGTKVLHYEPIPGQQVGCRPLTAEDRVSAL